MPKFNYIIFPVRVDDESGARHKMDRYLSDHMSNLLEVMRAMTGVRGICSPMDANEPFHNAGGYEDDEEEFMFSSVEEIHSWSRPPSAFVAGTGPDEDPEEEDEDAEVKNWMAENLAVMRQILAEVKVLADVARGVRPE